MMGMMARAGSLLIMINDVRVEIGVCVCVCVCPPCGGTAPLGALHLS